MTDYQLAQLQLAVYGQWDPHWDWFGAGEIVYGAKRIDGITNVVFRGSEVLLDFLRDLRAVPDPFAHRGLGPVHSGFFDGMERVWGELWHYTQGPWRVAGHSLGAARSAILAGLMVLNGTPPVERVVWGEPLSGFQQLATLIGNIPTRSYRNGGEHDHDPFTDLPEPIPPLFDYVRASPLIDISVRPDFGLSLDWHHIRPIGWHDMALYAEGMLSVSRSQGVHQK
jgi:hypothetical protein